MSFIAELVMYLVKFKIQIWIELISTHRNCLPYALSCHRIAEFRQRCAALGERYRSEPDYRWDGSEMVTTSTNSIIREVAILSKLAEIERYTEYSLRVGGTTQASAAAITNGFQYTWVLWSKNRLPDSARGYCRPSKQDLLRMPSSVGANGGNR